MSYHCGPCERSFSSKEGLKQHKRNSSSHNFKCEPCDRRYGSETALQQHLRDSRAHARSFDCNDCNRSFGTEEALQQHVRDSPAHTQSFDCNDCNISFGSEEELQQHQDSAVHTQSFDCNDRNRSFGSEEALEQHLRDFPNHQQNRETPLDAFFLSFPTFDYDPSLPPATSYNNLQRQQGWHHRSAESNEAWKEYQDALESELHLWYGEESDLTAWHSLCRAIGVEPLPNSCEQCEKVGNCSAEFGSIILTQSLGCTKDARQYH